jgi:hypothetical protein
MIVKNKNEWLVEYRKDKTKIWYWVRFDDESEWGFNDYNDWYQIIELKKKIIKVKLQYRSKIVELETPRNCKGVYLVRSILGRIGEDPIHTTTVGFLWKDIVKKTIYINIGLIERYTENSELKDCFSVAMNFQ